MVESQRVLPAHTKQLVRAIMKGIIYMVVNIQLYNKALFARASGIGGVAYS